MPSDQKIAANRKNARRSTGPRTAAGKRKVGQNALRHGLAVSILADPAMSVEVERLATALAGEGADSFRIGQARIVAEAELEVLRVRNARVALIEMKAAEPATDQSIRPEMNNCTTRPEEETLSDLSGSSAPESDCGAEAFLLALPLLMKFDRYERRAFSRRKRAIRCFDAKVV